MLGKNKEFQLASSMESKRGLEGKENPKARFYELLGEAVEEEIKKDEIGFSSKKLTKNQLPVFSEVSNKEEDRKLRVELHNKAVQYEEEEQVVKRKLDNLEDFEPKAVLGGYEFFNEHWLKKKAREIEKAVIDPIVYRTGSGDNSWLLAGDRKFLQESAGLIRRPEFFCVEIMYMTPGEFQEFIDKKIEESYSEWKTYGLDLPKEMTGTDLISLEERKRLVEIEGDNKTRRIIDELIGKGIPGMEDVKEEYVSEIEEIEKRPSEWEAEAWTEEDKKNAEKIRLFKNKLHYIINQNTQITKLEEAA
jgi:hypothetical protein